MLPYCTRSKHRACPSPCPRFALRASRISTTARTCRRKTAVSVRKRPRTGEHLFTRYALPRKRRSFRTRRVFVRPVLQAWPPPPIDGDADLDPGHREIGLVRLIDRGDVCSAATGRRACRAGGRTRSGDGDTCARNGYDGYRTTRVRRRAAACLKYRVLFKCPSGA